MIKQLLLFSGLLLNFCYASITVTSSLTPIQEAIEAADSNTLVVFDIDDVFIRPNDQILHQVHKAYRDKLIREKEKSLSGDVFMEMASIVFLDHKVSLVDPKILKILDILKTKNIKYIALTAAWTGKFGRISSLEQWRVDSLKKMNIDFQHSFPEFNDLIFTDLKTKDPGRHPAFKDGILLTCNVKKGKVLERFLQEYYSYHLLQDKPAPLFTKIIFIDDRRDNLESVANYCQEENIKFIGFEYTASAKQADMNLNKRRAKHQFSFLANHGRWLSDIEADATCPQESNGG